MELPIDIIIRVDAKKENDSGEYTFQCKVLGELVRCKDCKYRNDAILCPMCSEGMDTADNWFCADGKRKENENADS